MALDLQSVCIVTKNKVGPLLQGKYMSGQTAPLPSWELCSARFSCLRVSLLEGNWDGPILGSLRAFLLNLHLQKLMKMFKLLTLPIKNSCVVIQSKDSKIIILPDLFWVGF